MGDLPAGDVDRREMADRPAPWTDAASDGIQTRSPVLYEEIWNAALQPEPIYSLGRVDQTDRSIDLVDGHSPVLLIHTFFALPPLGTTRTRRKFF